MLDNNFFILHIDIKKAFFVREINHFQNGYIIYKCINETKFNIYLKNFIFVLRKYL